MIYEIKKSRLGERKAECIFCKKRVGFADYLYLCKDHGEVYYRISKFWRVLLPKVIIEFIMVLISQAAKLDTDFLKKLYSDKKYYNCSYRNIARREGTGIATEYFRYTNYWARFIPENIIYYIMKWWSK